MQIFNVLGNVDQSWKDLKWDVFSGALGALGGAALVVVLIAARFSTGLAVGLAAFGLFALSLAALVFRGEIVRKFNEEFDQGRVRRRPLAESIGKFAQRQQRYAGLLNLSEGDWQNWARVRFREVRGTPTDRQRDHPDDWPYDFKVYEELTSNADFEAAVRDWDPNGHRAELLVQIMNRRYEIYNWARYRDTSEERHRARNKVSAAIVGIDLERAEWAQQMARDLSARLGRDVTLDDIRSFLGQED